MKVKGVLLALSLALPVFGASVQQVKQTLLRTQTEFQELAIDIPFDKVYGSWKEKVRENYKTANRTLTEASTEMDRDPKRAAELIDSALSLYRAVGLLIPFYEIASPKVDEIVSRYLAAQDALSQSIRDLYGEPTTPTKPPYWRVANLAFVALPGTLSHLEADTKCRQLQFQYSTDWSLPTFKELATYFRQMKDPSQNPLFGAEAARYKEVWALDRYLPGDDYYYVDFSREKSGTASSAYRFQTVCVGTATSR